VGGGPYAGHLTALNFLSFLRHPTVPTAIQYPAGVSPTPPADHPITDRSVRRNSTDCKTSYSSTIAHGFWIGYISFEGGEPYRQGKPNHTFRFLEPADEGPAYGSHRGHVPSRFGLD
jgi:hypothetical protein